jgi:hypothetical protein
MAIGVFNAGAMEDRGFLNPFYQQQQTASDDETQYSSSNQLNLGPSSTAGTSGLRLRHWNTPTTPDSEVFV